MRPNRVFVYTALLSALLAEGVPASTLAKALRRTGMGRAEAYDLAQRLKDQV